MIVRPPRKEGLPGLRAVRGRGREATGIALLIAWSALVFFVGAGAQQTGFFGTVVRPALEGGLAAPANWLRGRLARPTRVEIERNGARLSIGLARGPLGASLAVTRRPPV